MTFPVDVWLRGSDFATTEAIETVLTPPATWTDDDVRQVLEEMLRTMNRLKNPRDTGRPVALRGLSWIVNPFDDGGVVIAIEITLGAAVAGPFAIDKGALETMIERVLSRPMTTPASTSVH